MSGWPVNSPSARDSASVSIGYFFDSVRKVGASARGLSPVLADRVAGCAVRGQQRLAALAAWQAVASCAARAMPAAGQTAAAATNSVKRAGAHRQFTAGGALAAIASLILSSNVFPNNGFSTIVPSRAIGPSDQGPGRIAGDQDDRRRNMQIPQLGHEIKAVHAWHVLVDDKTIEPRKVRASQQFSRTGVNADAKILRVRAKT